MVAIALLASACGGDDGGGGGGGAPTTTPQSSETTTPNTGDAVEVGRGVDDDAIHIGAAIIDFSLLKAVNVVIDRGDEKLVWESLVADINERGGVLGRNIEVTVKEYDLLQATSGEASCVEFAEDEEIFAVLNGYVAGAEGANKCIVDHGVAMFGGSPDPALAKTSPWVSIDASSERRLLLYANLFMKTGKFDGKKIAVIADARDENTVKDTLLPALEEAGHAPELTIYNDVPDGDLQATLANYDVYAERIRSAGVDHVVLVNTEAAGYTYLRQRGYEGEISTDNRDVVEGIGGIAELPKEAYDGYMTMDTVGADGWDHPKTQACVEAFEKRNPEIGDIRDPRQVPEGETDWGTGIAGACAWLDLFVQVLETAGAPNNDAILDAVTTKMAKLSIGPNEFASFGPDKFDANNGFRLAVFDSTLGENGGLAGDGDVIDLSDA
jgi:ABC-type branched-subunit amino acid transport system substrate-binding protein